MTKLRPYNVENEFCIFQLRLLPSTRDLAEPVASPSNSLRTIASASEGQTRKYSWKLVPGKADHVPYGTRLGPRKPYDITVPGL